MIATHLPGKERNKVSRMTAPKIRRKHVFLFAALALLTAAATLITYSLVLIIGSQIRSEEKLAEWDSYMAGISGSDLSEAVSEDPVSVVSGDPTAPPASPTPTPKPSAPYKPTMLGVLTFPSLDGKRVAVVEGTSKADLRGAAGHDPGTAPPGGAGNCIIYGHRDGVFICLKDIQVGDIFRIETVKGTFSYRVLSLTVVPRGDPYITKRYLTPVLTLVTCYPFRYTGHAPNRYVVVSEPIP